MLRALGERIARPQRAWRNRLWAHRARLGGRPPVAESLPEPVLSGDADLGFALVAGRWRALGHEVIIGPRSIWDAGLPDPRLEAARQACLWLDDLGALDNRPARGLAQAWVQDWIRRFGAGGGPGWQPEVAGRRLKRWTTHCAMLTEGLDRVASERFWRALAAQQRYLALAWPAAEEGLPRLQALAGLVWSGLVLSHAQHSAAVASMGELAAELIDAGGATPSRAPEDLAEVLILLIWTARVMENAGRHAAPAHLAAIARGVPILRPLRLGDGSVARFHGGGSGRPERIDQALAELKLGVQLKPKLAMGYARLAGGRVTLVMDGAEPPAAATTRAHAGTLAFEMSIGRQPVVVNAGPGRAFGGAWAGLARQTAAHSTVEIDARSSARIETRGLAARTFGARLVGGPSFVSVRQAQDATGQWLLATQDGYVASHGLLHERRLFVDARGLEARGEEILTVADARARAQFDRAATDGAVPFATRFHLHPAVEADIDTARQIVTLALPSGELWAFRAAGGLVELEESVRFDAAAPRPMPARQVVVHAEAVEYLGHVTWSFARLGEVPAAP
jgi:uncharacterized heparinase superfamily protein